jgi:hypothetical protein
MSNIAEQKALEAYPNKEETVYHSFFGVLKFDENAAERRGYQEGYDQAMKDFLEKASKYLFDNLPHTWDITQTVSFIDNFKNYMKNEM